uniref:Uncharacterized protein n=1 Tax=viral metagenome TaxID=1070528 RepID=A0A6C0J119_9ZZZZ
MTKNKFDVAATKAFVYPKKSVNTSSLPPSNLVNNQVSKSELKHNFIIDIAEGRVDTIIPEYKQSGGNNPNIYNYIINPLTNRKVSIYSKLGNNILKKYFYLTF